MTKDDGIPTRVRWARLRFQIIGSLLASPPESGELGAKLDELAAQTYVHPATGARVHFARSTIERWLYTARNEPKEPIRALERKIHGRAGTNPTIGPVLREAIRSQHQAHPRWSYKLQHDNLVAWAKTQPSMGRVPSYTTIRRYMKAHGLVRARSKSRSAAREAAVFLPREMRSWEVTHVHGLWHTDGHVGSRRVLLADGSYEKTHLLGVLDDHSRLGCHLQWYLGDERAETVVHCLRQAIQKRGLFRALLSDGGAGFVAAETTEGLARLSVDHHTTLPRTPEQNAKQENFWAQVEGRLMAMLEGQEPLTLELLNRATQAWVELEYNRERHSEIGQSPLSRFLEGPSVGRPSPSSEALRLAFRRQELRTQRRSDGTLTVEGVRFEVPARYRTIARPAVRYASWDLSSVTLVDARRDVALCEIYPLDKAKNADGRRRAVEPVGDLAEPAPSPTGIAPLLRELMEAYAATGLPPAYVPLPAASEENEP
jgi:transposase InsO family protein